MDKLLTYGARLSGLHVKPGFGHVDFREWISRDMTYVCSKCTQCKHYIEEK